MNKTNLVLLLTISTLLAKQGTSFFSFNFPTFNQTTPTIHLEQDSSLSPESLELTRNQNTRFCWNYGRASYESPVQLWDPSTGKLVDFATHFVFSIRGNESSGDGLTFFLSTFALEIADESAGQNLGLCPNSLAPNARAEDKFVAVEFDTYKNGFDPNSHHVGIDINSIHSAKYVNLREINSMKDGRLANAWVRYNSNFGELSVYLTYDSNPVFSEKYLILSYEVDLRDYLPEKVRVGFTASTGEFKQTHTVYSWSFNSGLDLIDENSLAPSPDTIIDPLTIKERRSDFGVGYLSVGFGVLLICGLGVLFCFVFWRKRRGKEIDEDEYDTSIDGELEREATLPKRFTYHELRVATEDFDDERKLGQGGFGCVYRGLLRGEPNVEIAVKRVSKGSSQGKEEYVSEVTIISRLRHKNLVQLIGWCHAKGEFLLVYEFMPNGSLDAHLFKTRKTILMWTIRRKIVHGLASALLYLHEECEEYVVHRDIKSSNVMLDSNFNAKLGDFGLARLADRESGLKTTRLAGTKGYMAPEYIAKGKASKESDVYSFGVVCLEICCGRRALETNEETSKVSIVDWVWDLYGKGKVLESADTRLSIKINEKEIERVMLVGLWCCHQDPSFRPSMKQVMSAVNFEIRVPNLTSEYPTPIYLEPSREFNDSSIVHGR